MPHDYTKRTSAADLYHLARILTVDQFHVCRLNELPQALANKRIKSIVVNLDSHGPGTHWVALYKPKKLYFDSYAQPAPKAVPRDYKLASNSKELQSIEATDCGGLCMLWLHYVCHKSNRKYYELFRDVY
jgi:hypothetical protein